MSLYFSGKDAYNTGHYKEAQEYFQQALIKDTNIEAKAQNIKYMLGVSAFNNMDYKTAKTYLTLYKGNPIAEDLLNKITQYEAELPVGFLYNNDVKEEPIITATSTSPGGSAVTNEKNNEKTISVTVIAIITSLLILAISLLLEIKSHFFSKMALKLTGASPYTLTKQSIQEASNPTPANEIELENPDTDTISSIDPKISTLLETPFDEEINVDEMASKDIEEISRFFEDSTIETDDDQLFETDNARDSILHSLIEETEETDEPNELYETDKNNNQAINGPETQKPKYEHLDSVPNDFDVNEVIKNAIEIIEITQKEQKDNPSPQQEWKTPEEKDKELEEKEKINLQYFQEMGKIDKDELNNFFDYIFDTYAMNS